MRWDLESGKRQKGGIWRRRREKEGESVGFVFDSRCVCVGLRERDGREDRT